MQNDAATKDDTYIPRYRLETHAQVEARVSRSRATLYAMRDPLDARFDPSFPEPVPVGPPSNPYSSIRFEASEIDEWIKSRMDMRRGKRTKPDCTNATGSPATETPARTRLPTPNPPRSRGADGH